MLKGDLLGNCEKGQHAWRPSYDRSGYPCPPVACKWCGVSRVAVDWGEE